MQSVRVLVLDGNENQAVACVRSLGRAGHRVRVGSERRWSKAAWSRFAQGSFTYAAPQHDVRAFIQSILAEIAGHPGTVVLPMTERTTLPLSKRRETIEAAGGILVLPSHTSLLRAFDKAQSTELARSVGLSVPWTGVLDDYQAARDVARKAPYPVVLKPRSSEEVDSLGRPRPTGPPLYARNAHEFMLAYDQVTSRCRAVLVQEFIRGGGLGYFALMRHGKLRAEFAHRRLRDVRPTGSGSALRESVPPDPAVRTGSLRMLEALGWHGVAMVEYRKRPDGVPVFLEINGRFWNSLALAVHSGVDFPRLLLQMAVADDIAPAPSYASGVRCRWLLGDVRHLLSVWYGAPAGFPGAFPGRFRTLLDFLRPVAGTHHDNFQIGDPLPELGDWLDLALHRLPSRRRPVLPLAQKETNAERCPSRP